MANNFFFENRSVYEIMWKNIVQRGRPHEKRAHAHYMLDAYKAANTDADCVVLISFTLQQRLNKRVSLLRYTYIACLV